MVINSYAQISVMYNLCNEPWLKYSLHEILDRGLLCSELTAAKLMSKCLYLETSAKRYELTWFKTAQRNHTISRDGQKTTDAGLINQNVSTSYVELYRWSHCKRPLTVKQLEAVERPLKNDELVDIRCDSLLDDESSETLKSVLVAWDEIIWLPEHVVVKGTKYNIQKMLFMLRS